MFHRQLFSQVVVVAASVWLGPSAFSQDYSNLLARSPFSAASPGGPQSTSESPLELRSLLFDQGEYFFSVYQPALRTSVWVGLNEPGQPFTIVGYDEKTETVRVDYQGRSLSLTLKESKIHSIAQKQGAATGTNPVGVQTSQPNLAPTSNDEATRLARIAEEIRRRRAQRQQANPPVQNSQRTPVPTPNQ